VGGLPTSPWTVIPAKERHPGENRDRNPGFFKIFWTPAPAPDCDPGFAGVTARTDIGEYTDSELLPISTIWERL